MQKLTHFLRKMKSSILKVCLDRGSGWIPTQLCTPSCESGAANAELPRQQYLSLPIIPPFTKGKRTTFTHCCTTETSMNSTQTCVDLPESHTGGKESSMFQFQNARLQTCPQLQPEMLQVLALPQKGAEHRSQEKEDCLRFSTLLHGANPQNLNK